MLWFRSKREAAESPAPEMSPCAAFCDASLDDGQHLAAFESLKAAFTTVAALLKPAELGEHLRSEDAKVRARASICLAMVFEDDALGACTGLTSNERAVVAAFVAARCADAPSAASSLRVLSALLARGVGDGVAQLAAKAVLGGEVHIPAHAQKTRQRAWDLIDAVLGVADFEASGVYGALRECLELDAGEASPTDAELVGRGFAAAIAGEKDPRCLVRGLNCAAKLLKAVDASGTDVVFEALAPYFPISFAPPDHDPYNISPEALRRALRAALCATPRSCARSLALAVEYVDKGDDDDERDEACALVADAAVLASDDAVAAQCGALGGALAADACETKRALETSLAAVGAMAARCVASNARWQAFFEDGALPALEVAFDESQIECVSSRHAASALIAVASRGARAWTDVVRVAGAPLAATARDSEISGRRHAALETLAALVGAAPPGVDVVEPECFDAVRSALLAACADSEAAGFGARGLAALARRGSTAAATDADVTAALAALCRVPGARAGAQLAVDVGVTARSRPDVALSVAREAASLNALASLCAAEGVTPVFLDRCAAAFAQNGTDDGSSATVALGAALERHCVGGAAGVALASRLLSHAPLVAALAQASVEDAAAAAVAHRAASHASTAARAACVEQLSDAPPSSVLAAVLCALDKRTDWTPRLASLAEALIDGLGRTNASGASALDSVEALLMRAPRNAIGALLLRLGAVDADAAARVVVSRSDADAAAYDRVASALATAPPSDVRALLADDVFGARDVATSHASRFWKQRLYARCAPHLFATGRSGGAGAAASLCALALAAPPSARVAHSAQLVDVAIFALADDAADDASALLDRLVGDSPDALKAVAAQLQRAFDALLAVTTTHKDPKARRDAIRTLGRLCDELGHTQLYPHRAKVALGLRAALDDDLRAIRHLAARVRNAWLIKVGGSIA
ncbi:Dos2-interacting transcription regulator of RNA-Pol-II-domain-containing protein [Pelagophyceae sp. CCMP2097]|nr:Dos2-interacting transcription regulator of RNA-Pol-II-domain-containing protein [Pelagophyceae sp. CCMP2097]